MFFWFFSLVFAGSVLRSVLFWLSYIQRKQYRIDRLMQAVEQPAFWRLFASKYRLALLMVFIAWQLGVRIWQSPQAFDVLTVAAALIFTLETILLLAHLVKRDLEIPTFTAKIAGLGVFILALEVIVLRLPWFGTAQAFAWQIISPEQAMLMEILQPFLVLSMFAIVFLPNRFLQKRLIAKATEKRKTLPGLTVIGITGSYGKTTMKEFVAHILGTQGIVLKTPSHINVDTGVANHILHELSPHHRWYVVEMGAYQPGEIKSLCDMTKPTYGMITALSNQHLELFGSLENLRNAKFELVDAIRDHSRLFMNAESTSLIQACEERGVNPHWFGVDERSELQAINVAYAEKGTTFTIDSLTFYIPGFGRARLVNALGAITCAKHLGLSLRDIAKACETLPEIDHTMQIRAGKNGALVLDATYNANTQGIIQAVADLTFISKLKKLIVFKDVIELGPDAEKDHVAIADAMAQAKADVFLLPSPWKSIMAQRLASQGVSVLETTPELTQDHVVLCLGREAQAIMNQRFV